MTNEELVRECRCAGAGFCELRNRVVSAKEHSLCDCSCLDPAFCQPELCQRRRVRWLNERRAAENGVLLPVPGVPAGTAIAVPGSGPGTELKKLLTSLGVTPKKGCGCEEFAGVMDRLGVEGCRREKDRIVAQLRTVQAKFGWLDRLRAAVKAVESGLIFHLSPLDPLPGLVDEAIRRAEHG